MIIIWLYSVHTFKDCLKFQNCGGQEEASKEWLGFLLAPFVLVLCGSTTIGLAIIVGCKSHAVRYENQGPRNLDSLLLFIFMTAVGSYSLFASLYLSQ